MVEQFGFAMILSSIVRTCPFISGTISFFSGSIRQADELSITMVPTSANFGAHYREVPPPAENIAASGASLMASSTLLTASALPLKGILLPTDLGDATRYRAVNGNRQPSRTQRLPLPTTPVHP